MIGKMMRVAALAVAMVLAFAAEAAMETPSLIVTTATDVIDPNDGQISLREALDYAKADSGTGALLDSGKYTISFGDAIFDSDGKVLLTMTAEMSIADSAFAYPVVFCGREDKSVVLTGGNGGFRFISIGKNNDVSFKNLTFRNFGDQESSGGVIYALYASGCKIDIENCAFYDNTGTTGSAIYARDCASLKIKNATFARNTAMTAATVSSSGSTKLFLLSTSFINNKGDSGSTSGRYALDVSGTGSAGDARIANTTFFGNYGGVSVNSTLPRFEVINSLFLGNKPEASDTHDLSFGSGSGMAVQMVNCLYADDSVLYPSATLKGVARVDAADAVDPAIRTFTYHGVEHTYVAPRGVSVCTGVQPEIDLDDPWGIDRFGYYYGHDEGHDVSLDGGSMSGDYIDCDQLGEYFDGEDYENYSIGAVYKVPADDAPAIRYDFTISSDMAILDGLSDGELPSVFVVPPVIQGFTVTGIGDYAFEDQEITSLSLPRALISIGEDAFESNFALQSVFFPDDGALTTIGDFAFGDCEALTSIVIPDSVTGVGESAFSGCSALTSATLGVHVGDDYFGGYVFDYCDNLASIAVKPGNANFASENGILYDAGKTRMIRVPPALDALPSTFPSTLTTIGSGAFCGARNLTTFVSPAGVNLIDYYAFEGCENLEAVVLGNDVTSLSFDAFLDCTALRTVELGNGITTVNSWTFENCPALETVTVKNPAIAFSAAAFYGTFDHDVEFIFTPPAGQAFAGWKKDGTFDASLGRGLSAFDLTLSLPSYKLTPAFKPLVTLTFNSNGGSTVASVTDAEGAPVAMPATPTKAGASFAGWYEDAGLTVDATWTMPVGGGTYYAKWSATPVAFKITFESNGGSAVEPIEALAGAAIVAPANPTKSGFAFAGWYTDAACTILYTFSTMPELNLTLYAKWIDTSIPLYTVTFESNGGAAVAPITAPAGTSIITPTLADRTAEGYGFAGWCADEELTTPFAVAVMPAEDKTAYAKWTPIVYPITYELDGGVNAAANPATYTVEDALALAAPTKDGYVFLGWSPNGGVIAAGSTGAKTFMAQWESQTPDLYANPASTPFLGNATYNGWVRDESGAIAGLLTVKAGKPAKPEKGGQSKLTVTYTPFGGKKQTIKLDAAAMPVAGGNPTVNIPGIGAVTFGGTSLAGEGLQVGADLAKSKDKPTKNAANARLARMNGTWTFALETDLGYAAFSLTVKKGKGKLSGTLPDGTKVSVSQQGILGKGVLAIPFAYAKKGSCGFVFWIADDGATVEVSDIAPVKLANGTTLAASLVKPSASHALAGGPHAFVTPDFAQPFTVAGKKWNIPKQQNPNAVKLTFTEKTGVVKGAYTIVSPAGKRKHTVNGVVVGGTFYGAAFSKGGAPVACGAE